MHCYFCDIIKGDLELNEHLDSKWLSKESMIKLDFAAADVPILKYL
jgi:8-oxo-dGTP diphosphatase